MEINVGDLDQLGEWGTPPDAPDASSTPHCEMDDLVVCGDLSPKTPTRRQMAKKYWQPNNEANECAMASCDNEFGGWPFSGRHHCRACGRVVCAACSLGTRMMHPPRGEPGGPKSVRVCDACFRLGQTFDFQPSPTAHHPSLRTLRRQNSDECLVSRDAGTMQQPAATNLSSFRSVRGLRKMASAPCLQSLAGRPASIGVAAGRAPAEGGHSRRSSDEPAGSHPSDDECSSSDTVVSKPCAPKCCDMVTMPQFIAAGKGMGPKRDSHRKIEDLADQDVLLAEKFRKLEANYAHSSYYQGLLEYEPEALKVLLMTEVSAQTKNARPQAQALG